MTTRKANRIYVHVLDWADPVLALPRAQVPAVPRRAYFLADGAPVPVTSSADALSLRLGSRRDPLDTVVVLELASK